MDCNVTCLDRLHVVNDNQDLIKRPWSKSRNVVRSLDEGIRSRSFCLRMRTLFSREIRYGIYVNDVFYWLNKLYMPHGEFNKQKAWRIHTRLVLTGQIETPKLPPPHTFFFTTFLRNSTKYSFTLRWSISHDVVCTLNDKGYTYFL